MSFAQKVVPKPQLTPDPLSTHNVDTFQDGTSSGVTPITVPKAQPAPDPHSTHEGGAFAASHQVKIGTNFTGSTIDISGFIAPDTNGAVGPNHFVELINGVYSAYDQTGSLFQQSSLNTFWTAAGVAPTGPFFSDPRVLYDPESGRWFAASVDNVGQLNHFLLAVSNTSDPTAGWHAVEFDTDPHKDHWADFPMLGINSDGVFLSANMFPVTATSTLTTFVAIPKADLLQPVPSVAGVTFFADLDRPDTGFSAQPAVAFGTSGSEPFLSAYSTSEGLLKISSVDGPITSPVLDVLDRFVGVPPASDPPTAVQEGTGVTIDTTDSRFASSVVLQNGKLFGVQNIDDGGHAALRWFMIGDPLSAPVLLDSGIIHPANLDVYFGSIAVNPLGQAVIGFSGSGPDDFPSAYAATGALVGNDLEFGTPILLKAGTGPFTANGGRWGDYSATTFDPDNPTHFWTIQEWSAGSLGVRENLWATQITEIIFDGSEDIPGFPDAPGLGATATLSLLNIFASGPGSAEVGARDVTVFTSVVDGLVPSQVASISGTFTASSDF